MNEGDRCTMYTLKIMCSRRGRCERKARLWVDCTFEDTGGHVHVDHKKLCFRCMTAYARWHRDKALVWRVEAIRP